MIPTYLKPVAHLAFYLRLQWTVPLRNRFTPPISTAIGQYFQLREQNSCSLMEDSTASPAQGLLKQRFFGRIGFRTRNPPVLASIIRTLCYTMKGLSWLFWILKD
ncbi:hypothetical protein AVEN_194088-1 [Araneus ventricosus]|uniref:Uncharacterized protein n=1 Tax=Araneus ventricosus TaxID=182803 RepID=A0A4Y2J9Y3_ARAVE|nr:hypothetical protein AVEN_194088-1 [Araneus ventricosus]